jgi:transposase
VRLQAAQMFAQDMDPVQIAGLLRVSAKSVYTWRRAWRGRGGGTGFPGPGREPVQAG